MLEAYSSNVTVGTNSNIPFNSTSIIKGCTVTKPSPDTINLNKCGVYMVECDCSTATSTTIQLYKNGVAQPQAQGTGLTPNFTTLVQVSEDNTCCPCTAPTTLQVRNTTAGTLIDCNIVVTKVC